MSDSPVSPRLVLDTNIVLDWLVFRDPAIAALAAAIEGRRVQVVTHPPAVEELQRVLAYPQCRLSPLEQREVLERYRSAVVMAELPEAFRTDNLMLPAGFPRCRDRDDEHFLALAYHTHAAGLVTKDKAVLKLRKKARRFGVVVLALRELATAERTLRTCDPEMTARILPVP